MPKNRAAAVWNNVPRETGRELHSKSITTVFFVVDGILSSNTKKYQCFNTYFLNDLTSQAHVTDI